MPWLPLPQGHQYIEAPLASPVPPIPVPVGTPACKAGQLEGVLMGSSGAGGNVNMPVLLRNRGASACFLDGYAGAAVTDASGHVLAQGSGATGLGTYFNDGPPVQVMLPPGTPALPPPGPGARRVGGQAFMNFSWYDCRPLQASRLALDLPGGGGVLIVPFAIKAAWSAMCDANSQSAPAVFRGPFSPSGVDWPPGLTTSM